MLTRRRMIAISAAMAASSWVPAAWAKPASRLWTGQALGARVSIRLDHPQAEAVAARVFAEIGRLENILSLYRADSALSRLNREGRLESPPFELLECLSIAGTVHKASGGRFDPTVQPLWALWAEAAASGMRPAQAEIERTLRKTGWEKIRLSPDAVVMEPGMALTLNGIAQGYITDRVTELLRANGLEHAMIDLGEARGLGSPAPGRPWRAGIADPRNPSRVLEAIDLGDRALATSGGYGTPLDPAGRFTHLFDPHTGEATPRWRSVTVRAADATTADALSTAFSQMPADMIRDMISRFPVQAWLMAPDDGGLIRLG